jgi:uncharacterized protein (DUF342 family)
MSMAGGTIVIGKKKPSEGGGMGAGKSLAGALPNSNEEISNLNRRMKMIEERYANLRSNFQVMEQNMLQKHKSFFTEIKTLNLEITEVKKEINELKDRMMMLIKEMELLARKESVETLRKYIDFWNPLNFVSKNEIEQIIREVIDKIRKESRQN